MFRYVQPVKRRAASERLEPIYDQIDDEFGLVPPFTVHSKLPELLAAVWAMVREPMLCGSVPRETKEALAAAVSRTNRCPYCVEAHTMFLDSLRRRDVARAIESGRTDQIDDEKIRSVVDWGLATRDAAAPILADPPFTAEEAPEIVGTAFAFHYVNRVMNALCEASPLPFGRSGPGWIRRLVKRFGARLFSRRVRHVRVPGASLSFLDQAPRSDAFSWAEPAPSVADAFARAAVVFERVGEQAIPDEARERVAARIEAWDGGDPPLGDAWVDSALEGLDAAEAAIARVALLAALASWKLDDAAVAAFRAADRRDEALLAAVAWGAYTATRRIFSWPEKGTFSFSAPR